MLYESEDTRYQATVGDTRRPASVAHGQQCASGTYLCACGLSLVGFSVAEPLLDFVFNLKNLNFFFSTSFFSAGAFKLASLLENKLFRDFLVELFFAISANR